MSRREPQEAALTDPVPLLLDLTDEQVEAQIGHAMAPWRDAAFSAGVRRVRELLAGAVETREAQCRQREAAADDRVRKATQRADAAEQQADDTLAEVSLLRSRLAALRERIGQGDGALTRTEIGRILEGTDLPDDL